MKPMEVEQKDKLWGRLALTAAAFFWSGNFVAGRALRDSVDPLTLNASRWVIAFAILAPFVVRAAWQQRKALRDQAGLILMLSVTGVIGFQIATYEALSKIPVVNAVLMLATTPVVILVGASLQARHRIPLIGWAAVILSILGVAVLLTDGRLAELLSARLGTGDIWMLVAVLFWSIYTLLLRRRSPETSGNVLLLMIVLPALPIMIAKALVWGETVAATLSGVELLAVLYIGIFPSLLAFLFWNYGVAKVGAASAGFFINLMPVFATALAWLLLGETVYPAQIVGAALIIGGIALAQSVTLSD